MRLHASVSTNVMATVYAGMKSSAVRVIVTESI